MENSDCVIQLLTTLKIARGSSSIYWHTNLVTFSNWRLSLHRSRAVSPIGNRDGALSPGVGDWTSPRDGFSQPAFNRLVIDD